MSGDRGSRAADMRRPSRGTPRLRTGTAVAGLALAALLVLLFTPGVLAQEGDTTPPAFGAAERQNATAIELTITDDTDVDESTITADDFTLDPADLDGIAVNESGSNAVVTLHLARRIESNNVTVALADGHGVADAAGNDLTDASVVVTGMDGFGPALQDFEVTRVNESAAHVTVVSSQRLSQLYVGVGGPAGRTLNISHFTEIDTASSFEVNYETTVRFDADGRYDLLVGTLVDENGKTSRYGIQRSFLVDRTSPNAVVGGPTRVDAGESATFTAAESSDAFSIANVSWAVDGNVTARGTTVETTFDQPGRHRVTATVVDRRGNVDTASVTVRVDSPVTSQDVAVESINTSTSSVTVGPNRTTGRVAIATQGGLASTPNVTLSSLTVDVPVDVTANLTVGASTDVPASFESTNTTAVATFDVEHERPRPSATFHFSVNRSRLSALGVDPDEVTLYRYTDRWRPIFTMRVGSVNGSVEYEATAPGLSTFVVGGPSDGDLSSGGSGTTNGDTNGSGQTPVAGARGTADLRVVDATVLTDSIESGERAIVRATVRNDGNATGTYTAALLVNGSVLDSEPVTVPPGENRTVTFAEPLASNGDLFVNGTVAGSVSVTGRNATSGGVAAENGTAADAGGLPIPNPLALWPGGLLGQILGVLVGGLLVVYAVLKSLAIYLGY